MPKSSEEPEPQTAAVPPVPPSVFLPAGFAAILSAAGVGIFAAAHASAVHRSAKLGLSIAFSLLFVGGVLLFAQARSLFWRQAAGVKDIAPTDVNFNRVDVKTRRSHRLTLLVLTVLALIPRLLVLRHSLWYDELWSVEDFMLRGPLHALTTQHGYNNHLLNSFLVSLLVNLRGAFFTAPSAQFMPPDWLTRLPAFVCGVASVPMLYITARQIMDAPPACAAAFLLALSPPAIDFSGQTRGYALLVFFTIAQTHFLIRALRTGAAQAWLGWLLCAWLGAFAHLYFVFVFVVDALFMGGLVLSSARSNRVRAQAWMEQGVFLAAWLALTAITYSGVLTAMRSELHRAAGTEPVALAHEVLLPMLQMWGGVPQQPLRMIFYAVASLLFLAGMASLLRRRLSAGIYIVLLLAVPPLLVEIAKPHYVYIRFFLFALPPFLTLLAAGMWEIAGGIIKGKTNSSGQTAALGAFALMFVMLTAPGLSAVIRLPKQDYKHAAQRIQLETQRGMFAAGTAPGSEWLKLYGAQIKYITTEAQLRKILAVHPEILVADADLIIHPRRPPPRLPGVVHRIAGEPIAIFPGRYHDWSYRWLDGDSDIKIYRVRADALPPATK